LDQALIAAKEAYGLHGGWEDGLLINRVVSESRQIWDLLRVIPVQSPLTATIFEGKASSPIDARLLLISVPKELKLYELSTGRPLKNLATPQNITRLLPMGASPRHVLAVGSTAAWIVSLDDFSVRAEKDFAPTRICGVDTNSTTLTFALSNDNIQIYSDNLKLIDERPFPANAKRVSGQEISKLSIGPNGNLIVAGAPTFHNECMVWDRKAKSIRIYPFNGRNLQFIDDATLVAFADDQGGHRATIYSINPEKIAEIASYSIPMADIGRHLKDASATKSEFVFAGNLGIGMITRSRGNRENQRGLPPTERYASILGMPSPYVRFTCLSRDGSMLALDNSSALLIFSRKEPVRYGGVDNIELNAALGPSRLYEVFQSSDALVLQMQEHGSINRRTWRFQLPAVPATNEKFTVYACGIDVSGDRSALAVRTLESEDWPVLTRKVANHSVAVYRELDLNSSRAKGGKFTIIRLRAQDRRAHRAARIESERILMLSRSGNRLLVGSAMERDSLAELYDTDSGALIREWSVASPLGCKVKRIPGQDVFADIAPQRRSIRLYSLSNGKQLKSINFADSIETFCPSSDGSAIVAALRSHNIVHYDLASDSTEKLSSRLLPISWSAKDDVFAAVDPELGQSDNGSVLIANCKTGVPIAILDRGVLGMPSAQFEPAGNVLLFASNNSRGYQLVQSISPDVADNRLISELERSIVVEKGDIDWTTCKPNEQTAVTLAAEDDKLREKLGQFVSLEAVVAEVIPTLDSRALNVLLSPKGSGVLLWVDSKAKPKFDAEFGGNFADAVLGKRLHVEGRLGEYGGRSKQWQGRLQISVTNPNQIKIRDGDSDQATEAEALINPPAEETKDAPSGAEPMGEAEKK